MSERIVEAIREGEIVRMPEFQALSEDLFILRPAETIEAKANAIIAKQLPPISERVLDLTKSGKNPSLIDKWRREKIDYRKNNVLRDLIPNFNWEISKVRRARNLTRKQLANAIGFSEEDIKIAENGGLPQDNFFLINKLESFLKISLRRDNHVSAEVNLAELQRRKEDEVKHSQTMNNRDSSVLGRDIEIVD